MACSSRAGQGPKPPRPTTQRGKLNAQSPSALRQIRVTRRVRRDSSGRPMNDERTSSAGVAPSLTHLPVVEILTRLDAAHDSSGGGVLATDADGTIWDGDVGVDIFEALLAAEGVREAALPALLAEAAAYGVAAESNPTAAARALYAAFSGERYPH